MALEADKTMDTLPAKQDYLENISAKIIEVRGHKVLLDADLAALYGVTTKRLNEQVQRNLDRFPEDFMFQLTQEEADSLRSQIATSNRGGRRYLPYAFTEHGAMMASSVLRSDIAIAMSIHIVRVFVHMRRFLQSQEELLSRLEYLEETTDERFEQVFEAIEKLQDPPNPPRVPIGFKNPKSSQ